MYLGSGLNDCLIDVSIGYFEFFVQYVFSLTLLDLLDSFDSEPWQGGRPKALSEDKQKPLNQLYKDESISVKEICQMLNISKPTLYKYLKSGNLPS